MRTVGLNSTGFRRYVCARFQLLERKCRLLERCCLYAVSMASKKLIDACRDGDIHTARSIVAAKEANPNTVSNTKDDDKTPLHYACQ